MPDDIEILLRRLVGGDENAVTDILARAQTDDAPALLVAAALVSDSSQAFIARAAENATTTRDRQVVAIGRAHLRGDVELLDALARDHLTDHPDNILVAWIAAQHMSAGGPAGSRNEE